MLLYLYVAHSIKVAKNCKYIDQIIVSSDSETILNYSKKKSEALLKDQKNYLLKKAEIKDVILDVLRKIKVKFDIFCSFATDNTNHITT